LGEKCPVCGRKAGEIVGKRQAELLRVRECEQIGCPMKHSKFCSVGKLKEGRWR